MTFAPHHYRRALDWFYERHIAEAPERHEAARKEAAERSRLIAEGRSVVYFLRREPDGLIKIGFSTAYKSRFYKIRREHGPLVLLLAIAGGRAEENGLHEKFDRLRVTGEWFRPERELLRWIAGERGAAEHHAETRLPKQVPIEQIRALLKTSRTAKAA